MRTITKLALGALMLAGTAAATMAPADAGVSIGVNVGAPGVAVAYGNGNACFRPYRFRPAYCGDRVYGSPLFIDGAWYSGPVAYRYEGGARYFRIHDRWVHDRDDFHHARVLRADHDGRRR